jgi:prolyl-tRNA editing enzyme YbaK/EbsC (Cys-tRNA(Pro) deacylase)
MTDILEDPGVKRVIAALDAAKQPTDVLTLKASAATAKDAAKAVGCELGAIVKSLVFLVGDRFALVLIAGDRTCAPENLARVLNLKGAARLAEPGEVRFATGFAPGGVAPVGLARKLPCVLDRSLKRFETVFAAAGHPHCVFSTTVDALKEMTGAIVSYGIVAEGAGTPVPAPSPAPAAPKPAGRKK